jgi:hypothetical protein
MMRAAVTIDIINQGSMTTPRRKTEMTLEEELELIWDKHQKRMKLNDDLFTILDPRCRTVSDADDIGNGRQGTCGHRHVLITRTYGHRHVLITRGRQDVTPCRLAQLNHPLSEQPHGLFQQLVDLMRSGESKEPR